MKLQGLSAFSVYEVDKVTPIADAYVGLRNVGLNVSPIVGVKQKVSQWKFYRAYLSLFAKRDGKEIALKPIELWFKNENCARPV
jgi:hypothetical protein